MSDVMDEREEFENCFYHFVESLKVLASDAEAQCDLLNGYNVPWELQHDVVQGCRSIVGSAASYLTPDQVRKVNELARQVGAIPLEAVSPPGNVTTNLSGSLAAMKHPAWEPVRLSAKELLTLLAAQIERNVSFFYPPASP